jgi:hypothetical protein
MGGDVAAVTAELEVGERVRAVVAERDAMVNLEPVASAAADAHPVPRSHLVRS